MKETRITEEFNTALQLNSPFPRGNLSRIFSSLYWLFENPNSWTCKISPIPEIKLLWKIDMSCKYQWKFITLSFKHQSLLNKLSVFICNVRSFILKNIYFSKNFILNSNSKIHCFKDKVYMISV